MTDNLGNTSVYSIIDGYLISNNAGTNAIANVKFHYDYTDGDWFFWIYKWNGKVDENLVESLAKWCWNSGNHA